MTKILYLSLVDWFWIKQRPHHICEGLSKNHKVIYFTRRSFKKNSSLKTSHQNMSSMYNADSFSINNNLQVVRKKIIPFQGKFKVIKEINNFILRRTIEKLDKKYCFDTIIITNPNDLEILSDSLINNKNLIYDCMDNYKNFPGQDKNEIIKNEVRLMKFSNKIIASSNELKSELLKYNLGVNKKIKVINNGVDTQKFSMKIYGKQDIPVFLTEDNRKKVCYIGTISSWVDLELIYNIAMKHRDISFYLVGPVDNSINLNRYVELDNIFFTGVQSYEIIPLILNGIDVAIMPFIINDLVLSVNPVKIYEYLAMGKPVIATKYSETEKFGDLINTFKNQNEFETILLKILFSTTSNDEISKKINFAFENSWDIRVKEFQKIISEKEKVIDEN